MMIEPIQPRGHVMKVGTVIVSGMHSGPNPSPGLGVARSLKLARPGLRIVGLDYSSNSSGLHTDKVDEVLLFPEWNEMDIDTWVKQIRQLLETDGVVMIPCLDLEVRLLALELGNCSGILSPSADAVKFAGKPPFEVAEVMNMSVPASEFSTDWPSVERFTRQSSQNVWVKGENYEAFKSHSSLEAIALGNMVQQTWGGDWHLEEHVRGQECGIAFCAVKGRLIDAVFMTKSLQTGEGKTWAGEISEVPTDIQTHLEELVRQMEWTGGGELELIQSWNGEFTLMEFNPRFPAWIHGATVCGANLPLSLITGTAKQRTKLASPGFTRVIEEIPVRPNLGLSPFIWPSGDFRSSSGKHPSGMPQLAHRRLLSAPRVSDDQSSFSRGQVDRDDLHGFERLLEPPSGKITPFRQVLLPLFTKKVEELKHNVKDLGQFVLAHSVKTCAQPTVLAEAARLGMIAEATNQAELQNADRRGLKASNAILNGPAKWWPSQNEVSCGAFFADSVDELRQVRQMLDDGFRLDANVVGIRIAPFRTPSRFGVDISDAKTFFDVVELVASISHRLGASWGMHFHHAESDLGAERWQLECASALQVADSMANELGASPAVLDFGGGWDVEDMSLLGPSLKQVLLNGPSVCREGAPLLVLEPGKILCQPSAVIVTQVIARSRSGGDLVVDAALGDIPTGPYWPHPIALFDGSEWVSLLPGKDRLLGRSCMENDVLAKWINLKEIRLGDYLAVGMCGAYDTSMAYQFGLGTPPQEIGRQ